MRDIRFIAEHRGGPLKKEQHRQLIIWACSCAEHVFPLLSEQSYERLKNVLFIAKEWEEGKATTGDARNASLNAIAMANESSDPVTVAIARAVGHAVATAHMAEHSLVAASYSLKAVSDAGKSTDAEKIWQNTQLPSEITELVLTSRNKTAH
jgi:hypothetical protein